VTFASAERAYLTPPDDDSCTRCEDGDAMDHADCIEAAADAYDDAMADRAQAYREVSEGW
jgi:hypothetical protein